MQTTEPLSHCNEPVLSQQNRESGAAGAGMPGPAAAAVTQGIAAASPRLEPGQEAQGSSRPFAPNVRFERVERIRRALASGEYKVDAGIIADCLIAHLRRS